MGDPSNEDIVIKTSAPGKVILHGEHSVVYDKLAIAASLDLRTNVTLTVRSGNAAEKDEIEVRLPDLSLKHSFKIEEIEPFWEIARKLSSTSEPDTLFDFIFPLLENFVNTLEDFNKQEKQSLTSLLFLVSGILGSRSIDLRSFELVVNGRLSIGAGTGSSASYAVSTAAALCRYAETVTAGLETLPKIGYDVELKLPGKFTAEMLQNISIWAFNSERIIHGKPSGIDNTVCTYGSFVKFRKSTGPEILPLKKVFEILLIDTGVARDTKSLVAKVQNSAAFYPDVVNPILESMEAVAVAAFDCLKGMDADNEWAAGVEFDQQLSFLVDVNQNLLAALGVSHPSLNRICEILKEHELVGKLTGAGGGGYAFSYLPDAFDSGKLESIKNCLKTYNFVCVVAKLGGEGVRID